MDRPHIEPERHEFAAAGCTYDQFAYRFGMTRSGAFAWMKRHGYEPVFENATDIDLSPRSIDLAYCALAASILGNIGVGKALRRVAR